jgi:hypothetical protein
VEQVILGVRNEFQALGRPDAQKVLVILAAGPPEDSPFEKAWMLREQLNCTVLVVFPQPASSSVAYEVFATDASYDNVASSPAHGKYIKLERSFDVAADNVDQYINLIQVCSAEVADRGLNPLLDTLSTQTPFPDISTPFPDIFVRSTFPGLGGPSDLVSTSPSPFPEFVQSALPGGGGPSTLVPTSPGPATTNPVVERPSPAPAVREPKFRLADYHFVEPVVGQTHTGARPEPCCGSEGHLVEEADPNTCVKVGDADLSALIHNRNASETFGDNVGIDKYEYFLEHCKQEVSPMTECSYTKITDPDIDGHVFKVGVSNIKIRSVDFYNNKYECMRTIYVYDKQRPYFTDPDFVPIHPHHEPDEINVEVPDDSCVVENEAGFVRHADLGFQTAAADNCDVAGRSHFGLRASDPGGVHLRKLIYSYNPDDGLDTSGARLLYDSDDASSSPTSTSAGLVPGTYQMTYLLIDDYSEPFDFPVDEDLPEWHQFNHSVLLTVVDLTPPTSIDKCPDNISIEIEPWEMSAVVNWTVPQVDGDNCLLGYSLPPPQAEEFTNKYPGMSMDVGAHIVKYSFMDAQGNPYHEECIFEVRISHKNKPLDLTCPSLEVFDTLNNSNFAIVSWPTPVALQNGQVLDASHITYEPSVAPGMPFPFGETTIKVIARGENYSAVKEGHQELETDECYFKVKVGDPQKPECDGREYRCAAQASGVKPYGVCDGPELIVSFHDGYESTSEYEATGVRKLADEACCTSEAEVAHECSVISGTGSKQCTPVGR